MKSNELTKREAAEVLECDLSTVNRMITAGRLTSKPVEAAGQVRFHVLNRRQVEAVASERNSEQVAS